MYGRGVGAEGGREGNQEGQKLAQAPAPGRGGSTAAMAFTETKEAMTSPAVANPMKGRWASSGRGSRARTVWRGAGAYDAGAGSASSEGEAVPERRRGSKRGSA